MDPVDGREDLALVRTTKIRLAVIIFGVLALFLFSSELVNSLFNNRLDQLGASAGARILFALKPTVIGLFVVFAAVLFAIVLHLLQPLLNFVKTGADQQKARNAAVNVPWIIIIFQIVAWTIGTTLYYLLNGWQAESGIPYGFGLLLKLAVGLPAGVYSSVLLNIALIPVKRRLLVTEVRTTENDRFSRYRDLIAIAAVIVFITANYSYVVYYFTGVSEPVPAGRLAVLLVPLAFFYALVSFGLIAISKLEYFVQVRSLHSVLADMAAGKTSDDQRISILNFNELGAITGLVNTVLDNFSDLLAQINQIAGDLAASSKRLAAAGQQNAAYSNQQAAGASEIVSTMEGVNRLSTDISALVKKVAELSAATKDGVLKGFSITKQNIVNMNEVTESYADTIDGMKNLGEHISGIWEIVKIINGIAGQIKIIAFNAALEASSAGEAGKNFEIVASEIRRLADSTVSSTNEIRARIAEIERASDDLISSSEVDTGKIQDARKMADDLEAVFGTIRSVSENTSNSAGDMSNAVGQQIRAFEQVLITSRQMAEGIHEFTGSIEESGNTARELERTMAQLRTIVDRSSTAN